VREKPLNQPSLHSHTEVRPRPASGQFWRCRTCAALLGIVNGGQLHVKYKDTEIWVVGICHRRCRRCGERNEMVTGAAPGKGAA